MKAIKGLHGCIAFEIIELKNGCKKILPRLTLTLIFSEPREMQEFPGGYAQALDISSTEFDASPQQLTMIAKQMIELATKAEQQQGELSNLLQEGKTTDK